MAGKRKRSTIVECFHFVTGGIFDGAGFVTPLVQDSAECAVRARASIAAVPTLKARPGGTYGCVLIRPGLGYFDVPAFDAAFLLGPKGTRRCSRRSRTVPVPFPSLL